MEPSYKANYDDNYRFAFGYNNLSDTCWRNIHSFPVVPFYIPCVPGQNDGVYFNGTLNWLALRTNYVWDDTIIIAQLVIVSLDLGMEAYTQLLRRLDETLPVEPTIGVLMDCLCFSHDCKETHFVVWQMKEFGVEKSWTQFMKISYQYLQIDCYDFTYPWLPLCMSEDGDVLIMASISESQDILYHRRDNRVEPTELPYYIFWNSTMDYVERSATLASRTSCIIDGMWRDGSKVGRMKGPYCSLSFYFSSKCRFCIRLLWPY